MTGGRKGTVLSLATFLGWGGALVRWGAVYVETVWAAYWQYLLAYICVFGVIGYFTTFYALSGGALAPCVVHASRAPEHARGGPAWPCLGDTVEMTGALATGQRHLPHCCYSGRPESAPRPPPPHPPAHSRSQQGCPCATCPLFRACRRHPPIPPSRSFRHPPAPPRSWKTVLLTQLLRLGACGLLLCASHSARASIATLLLVLLLWAAPTRYLSALLEPAPARPPLLYTPSDEGIPPTPRRAGQRRPQSDRALQWRPPTVSGRYLSQAEYEMQRDLTTEMELRALLLSPQMQQHLVSAAMSGRLRVEAPDVPDD